MTGLGQTWARAQGSFGSEREGLSKPATVGSDDREHWKALGQVLRVGMVRGTLTLGYPSVAPCGERSGLCSSDTYPVTRDPISGLGKSYQPLSRCSPLQVPAALRHHQCLWCFQSEKGLLVISQVTATNPRPKLPLLRAQDQAGTPWWPRVLWVVGKNDAGPDQALGHNLGPASPCLPHVPGACECSDYTICKLQSRLSASVSEIRDLYLCLLPPEPGKAGAEFGADSLAPWG